MKNINVDSPEGMTIVVLLAILAGMLYFMPLNPILVFALWGLNVSLSVPYWLVKVPEVTGLVFMNPLKSPGRDDKGKTKMENPDNLRAVGPGFHVHWPWETVRKENFFSLELVTPKERTDLYASRDGVQLQIRWSYQYRPNLDRLKTFIGIDESTIRRGFEGMIGGCFSEAIGSKLSVEAREQIEQIQNDVLELFKKPGQVNGVKSRKEKLEDDYGVDFKIIVVADIDYPDDFQKAWAGKARMKQIVEAAKLIGVTPETRGLKEEDREPTQKAMNLVLVEQSKAGKQIYEIEGLGDEPIPVLAQAIASHFVKKKEG